MTLRDTSWTDDASCRGIPTEMFFAPDTRHSGGDAVYADGKRLCDICPVRKECLDAAMAEEQGHTTYRYGLRGGMTPTERARLAAGADGITDRCVDCGALKTRSRSLRCKPCFVESRRRVAECKRGHALDGANLRINNRGARVCRECTRLYVETAKAKRRRGAA